MSKFTPGNWECKQWRVRDHEGELMSMGWDVSVDGHLLPTCAQTGDEEEAEANVRLMAAAPDLLEALREITADYADRFDLSDPSTNPGIVSSVAQARAAIAKALGESK